MFDAMQIDEMSILSLVAKGAEVGPDGTRNFAYHGTLWIKEGEVNFSGYGGCKNTEVAYAHGATHAIDYLIRNDCEQALEVMVVKNGFRSYIERYVAEWIANNGKNKKGETPKEYEVWKRLYLLKEISRSLKITKIGKWEGGRQIAKLEKLNDKLLKSLPKQPLGIVWQSEE